MGGCPTPLPTKVPGTHDNWSMNQHRDDVHVDDRIYFWRSGAQAALVATGRIVSLPYERSESDFGRWAVDVVYEHKVHPPLERTAVLAHQDLQNCRPFVGAFGTNFPLPRIHADAIAGLVQPLLVSLKGTLQTNHSRELHEAIQQHNAHVEQELLRTVRGMPWAAFEELVKALLERLGYEQVSRSGPGGDNGIDIHAVLRAGGVADVQTIVQAKRWTTSVPPRVIRDLRGTLKAGQAGLVITTAAFTKAALAEATSEGKVPIALVDGPTLVHLMVKKEIGAIHHKLPVLALDPEGLPTGS